MKKWLILLFVPFLLTGCGTAENADSTSGSSGNSPDETSETPSKYRESEAVFITQILQDEKRVLVKDIIFGIDEDTELVDDKEEEVSFDDLELGMRVVVESTGMMLESYPGQTGAKSLIVLTDVQSKQEAEAVAAVVQELDKEAPDRFKILKQFEEKDGSYELHFDTMSTGDTDESYSYDPKTKTATKVEKSEE